MSTSIFCFNRQSKIKKKARILAFCRIYMSSVDDYTYIGRKSVVVNSKIGKYCSIAPGSIIGAAKHPIEYVSTSPLFYSDKNILKKSFSVFNFEEYETTYIGNDVWIGANCVIKTGVKIGDGAIIGAGAIVTKDVAPYSIIGGVPGKVIKKRFNEEQIAALLKIKWWDWEEEKIINNAGLFNDIDKFIDFHITKKKIGD